MNPQHNSLISKQVINYLTKEIKNKSSSKPYILTHILQYQLILCELQTLKRYKGLLSIETVYDISIFFLVFQIITTKVEL